MPVTAKLSREFYDKLGDDVANELVGWFNQVDAAYRSELRELGDGYFSRFDSKLEQRVAQLDAKLEQRVAQLDAKLERRLAEVKAELREEIGGLRTEVRAGFAELRAELLKWMFLYWAGSALTVIGLLKL